MTADAFSCSRRRAALVLVLSLATVAACQTVSAEPGAGDGNLATSEVSHIWRQQI
ncbi:hypothetical protein [Terrabacter terrae]|uniref:hypothetical protein n=1 Tax=Terrabacter terrae TaxID=318434 RepID=UPI0031DC6A9B